MQKRGYLVIFSLLIVSMFIIAGCKEAVGGVPKAGDLRQRSAGSSAAPDTLTNVLDSSSADIRFQWNDNCIYANFPIKDVVGNCYIVKSCQEAYLTKPYRTEYTTPFGTTYRMVTTDESPLGIMKYAVVDAYSPQECQGAQIQALPDQLMVVDKSSFN